MKIQRIVVGLDGSANGARAMAWAVDLAEVVKAEIVAVHAVGLLDHTPGHVDPAETGRLLEAEWAGELAARGIGARWQVLDGDPVSVLMRVVGDEQADLVVVGTRGRGERPGLLLGSTSHQLAERCSRPVVIVPAGA